MPQVEVHPPKTPSGWTFDKRQAIGAGLALFCLGVLIGAKIAAGTPALIERPVPFPVRQPCAECAQREATGERVEEPHGPDFTVPGDSSIPDD